MKVGEALAFRLKYCIRRTKRLFERVDHRRADAIGVRLTDADGNFLHVLCPREQGIRLLHSRNAISVPRNGYGRAGD
ncbi:MAG: hypothetical protein ACREPP_00880 [Rhodanobacteraceae bacterium]